MSSRRDRERENAARLEKAMRESNMTWDLCAKLSKNETPDVYNMVLRVYKDGEGGKRVSGSAATGERSYLCMPDVGVDELITAFGMQEAIDTSASHRKNTAVASIKNAVTATSSDRPAKIKKKKAPPVKKADIVRHQQIKQRAVECKALFRCKKLNDDFKTVVVDTALFYYVRISYEALKKKDVKTFIDATLSLRDASRYFIETATTLSHRTIDIVNAYLDYAITKVPWKSFLENYTQFLMRNHFKKHFNRASRPFPEQAALIEQLRVNPHRLFVLPWGVGAGKTAMIAPLSRIFESEQYQTLYCVPFGPVRDQSASLLYRCAIPFAYVVRSPDGTYDLQPSFHCSNGVSPSVLVVDPSFVRYYLTYWAKFRILTDGNTALMDPSENPPAITIPSDKKRYRHLTHRSCWNHRIALVMDEPDGEHPDMMWLLHNAPIATVVMSATSHQLVDDEVRERYHERFYPQHDTEHADDPGVCIIPATSIGVSTTLTAGWLDGDPVISPFSGACSRERFVEKYDQMRSSILWRRFLSADVLIDWAFKLKTHVPHMKLSIMFDLHTMTFDHISTRILEWAKMVIDTVEDDAVYQQLFDFPVAADVPMHVDHILSTHAHLYSGGCVIGTPNVPSLYTKVDPLLASFPSIGTVAARVKENETRIRAAHIDINKLVVKKGDDMQCKNDFRTDADEERMSSLPIHPSLVLNTPEHVAANQCAIDKTRQQPPYANRPIQYARIQSLVENGDPAIDAHAWRLGPDLIQGISDAEQRWRWKGFGSITLNKECNVKNMRDLATNELSFMAVDNLGAYGLNLPISHCVLHDTEDDGMLRPDIALQVAGRVGRPQQDHCGYVHLASKRIFENVFDM